jgi:hypothetical protein
MADYYIRASELRPKLGNSIPHDWRVVQLRELCKCETDNDAKRATQRETVPEPQQGKRETSTTELQKLNPETTRRLRAINRAPEIVGRLYDVGTICR